MTLATHEFIRRFLLHVLPKGFHRIRHYGLFANGNRAANIARARELLAVPSILPLATRRGDRLLSEPTAGALPWRRERVLMPQSRPPGMACEWPRR